MTIRLPLPGVSKSLAALTAMLLATGSGAQSAAEAGYPNRPIRIVAGSAPGGGIDFVSRLLAQKMFDTSGYNVVVENRPGAGTTVGGGSVARAAPDGYTVFMASTSFAIAPGLYKSLPYDTARDFAPVTLLASGPLLLVVNLDVPAKSVSELITWAKSRPGKVTFGSSGTGTSVHLAGELFKASAGFDFVHVPYKGGSLATTDLIAGRVEMLFSGVLEILPQVKAGRVRALAVTGMRRSPLMPELPTITESGFQFEVSSWYGLLAPAGTARPVINRLHEIVVKALADADLRSRLAAQAVDVIGDGPDKFGPYWQNEIVKWTRVTSQANIPKE